MLSKFVKNLLCSEERAVRSFRFYSYIYRKISRLLGYFLYQRSKLKFGVDIAPTAIIGRDFKIAHLGGIVIGKSVIIGNSCTINSGATLGMAGLQDESMPTIGDEVYISTGAKILGGVHIGNGSIVGANAVVISSFPEGVTVVGVPAKKVGDHAKD